MASPPDRELAAVPSSRMLDQTLSPKLDRTTGAMHLDLPELWSPPMPQFHRYQIARQRHVGETLNRLEALGVLRWEWEYDVPHRQAFYWIIVGDAPRKRYGTKDTERMVQDLCDRHGIIWEPVPHPGGEDRYEATRQRIAERERQATDPPVR